LWSESSNTICFPKSTICFPKSTICLPKSAIHYLFARVYYLFSQLVSSECHLLNVVVVICLKESSDTSCLPGSVECPFLHRQKRSVPSNH
jgi:hypothetical protein